VNYALFGRAVRERGPRVARNSDKIAFVPTQTTKGAVRYELQSGVAWVTIERPDAHNALNEAVRQALFESFERFVADADAKVLVLTGAGDRSFCAGADLDELAEAGARVPRAGAVPIFGHNFEMPKPSIAAVNGLASGEGFLLAQMCDLCIAAHTATFVLDEAKLGLGAPWAMPLPWLVPPRVAMQMLITGEPVDAHRAREIGLVNEVVSLSDVRTRTQRLGESIAANAPLSVAAARTMLYAVARGAPVNAFDEADRIWETVYTSEDAQEGPRALREGRPPQWQGR
jgi:enoyl-CoA hydratase/carnithine racemase